MYLTHPIIPTRIVRKQFNGQGTMKPRNRISLYFLPSRFSTLVIVVLILALLLLVNGYRNSSSNSNEPKSTNTVTVTNQQPIITTATQPQHPPSPPQIKNSWQKVVVEPGDSLAIIFQRYHLSAQTLQKVLALGVETEELKHLKPGQLIKLEISPQQQLLTLIVSVSPEKSIIIKRVNQQFKLTIHKKKLENQIVFAQGRIEQNFYQAAKKSGLNAQIQKQLATIFHSQVNFNKHLRKNDTYKVLYETYTNSGKRIRTGNIITAELINNGKKFIAIRYTTPNGKSGYFTPTGKNLQQTFAGFPIHFDRISSRFKKKRDHPILGLIRPHNGVDLPAPIGTAIKAPCAGMIVFIGRQRGYGKTIILKHNNKYKTLYAHLNGYATDIKKGSQVKAGQIIAYVGKTGLATAPHLHYEIHVNNVPRNPLAIKIPTATATINKNDRPKFLHYAQKLIALLNKDAHSKSTTQIAA